MKSMFILSLVAVLCTSVDAQNEPLYRRTSSSAQVFDDSLFHGMKWRNIGPFRGGRSTTVCGVVQDPFTFYFGSTGGGVWKSSDGGASWRNISDGYFKTGSVGAIAVAPSDPNVIYVGMGEAPVRGVMTSHGDGLYKSTDAGHTWTHMGLDRSRQISQIRVHPTNPDWVYVAVQGSPYQPTNDRGLYRSKNGGLDWEQVHFVDESSGACDLSMDMQNPRVLYAAYWDHQRLPWQMRSGGEGSGIWKTTNGGDTWSELSQGLPDSIMGKIGVVVSPANSSRVYAIIESKQGGLYRSDNAGRSWSLINEDRILRARSWYYMHIFADPVNPDKVMVLNAPYMQSTDGGKSFRRVATPHGDNHALWIHPDNPMIMINGNDGGANVSYNGGRTWSTQSNQPTAQFYRVNVDNRFPYYVYGGQQDNSTVAIPNAVSGAGIPNQDFYRVGGCESAYTAFDPDDPRLVYAGCYQGIITEYDTELKSSKDIMAYTHLGLGEKPLDMKYRFNWNAPIILSEHDREVLYHAGNKLLKSMDRGLHWQEISPDLTRNTVEKLNWGGGPITNEGAGGENYHTIMYVAESKHDPQVLWVGTDDGLVHVTQDGGAQWTDITPPQMEEGIVNCIDASAHEPGKAVVAFTRYKFNDFTPHIFITEDYGQSWRRAVRGIGEEAHVRTVREDPTRSGLLYAGTETGMYVSFDDGANWSNFQLNLPIVPITDMKVHQGDLVVATQGRAFWILDDLTPVREWSGAMSGRNQLFTPGIATLWGGPRNDSLSDRGANPDFGLMSYYYLADPVDTVQASYWITDSEGRELKSYSSQAKKKPDQLKVKKGLNKLVWNLVPEGEEPIKGLMTLGGNASPRVGSGNYKIFLSIAGDTLQSDFAVQYDPRMEIAPADLEEKNLWLARLDEAAQEVVKTVKVMRYIKTQVEALQGRAEMAADSALSKSGKALVSQIDSLESQLVQAKQKTFQDVINFPNQLDAKLRHIQGIIEGSYPPVTSGQTSRAADVLSEWQERKGQWMDLLEGDVADYNEAIKQSDIPFIGTRLRDDKKKGRS